MLTFQYDGNFDTKSENDTSANIFSDYSDHVHCNFCFSSEYDWRQGLQGVCFVEGGF